MNFLFVVSCEEKHKIARRAIQAPALAGQFFDFRPPLGGLKPFSSGRTQCFSCAVPILEEMKFLVGSVRNASAYGVMS